MSCTFWNLRRKKAKMAALNQNKEQSEGVVEVQEEKKETTPKKRAKK